MAEQPVSLERARAAKEKAKQLLAGVRQVNGIGIGRRGEDYAVKVNLEAALDDPASLPESIDGVPVLVHVVQRIRKQ